MRICAFALTVAVVLALPMARGDEAKKLAPQSVGGIDAKSGGTVTGVIRFQGIKPQAEPIKEIGGNAFCKEHQENSELPQHDNFVFGKNGNDDTLVNVLVYVSKGLDGKTFEAPKEPAVLDQVGCMYTPHVVGVMVGQTLEIRNSDATLHNVMTMPRENPPFNIGMPVQGSKLERVFKKPEFKMNFRCFMHPWMSGYVHVMANPFFAVSGVDGKYTIRGLPPGEYEISVLHETSMFEPAPAVMKVSVGAGETKAADFVFKPKGGKN
jgi:plastocyanin